MNERQQQVFELVGNLNTRFKETHIESWLVDHLDRAKEYWALWDQFDNECKAYIDKQPLIMWEDVRKTARDLFVMPLVK
jgi:hypothetical protein